MSVNRYSRAYRDPNSPLTPLTPLASNFFDFNINSEQSSGSGSGLNPLKVCKAALAMVRQSPTNSQCSGNSSRNSPWDAIERKQKGHSLKSSNKSRTPIPPPRLKRSIMAAPKNEQQVENLPSINIIPPPRRKRRSQPEPLNIQIKQEDPDSDIEFVPSPSHHSTELYESNQSTHQQQQWEEHPMPVQRKRFDASNVRLASPVAPKPLSPRLGEFLTRWGINCLKSIFERQEIDLQTFCCLTPDDLELLGIQDPGIRENVIKAINFVSNLKNF